MNERCKHCDHEINDTTEHCPGCNANIRAERAEERAEMATSAASGWWRKHDELESEHAHTKAALAAKEESLAPSWREWMSVVEGWAKTPAAELVDELTDAPTPGAIATSLRLMRRLRDSNPESPPTAVARGPNGEIVIERRQGQRATQLIIYEIGDEVTTHGPTRCPLECAKWMYADARKFSQKGRKDATGNSTRTTD